MQNLPAPIPFEQLYGGPLDGLMIEQAQVVAGFCEIPVASKTVKLPKTDTHIQTWKPAPDSKIDAYATYRRRDDGRLVMHKLRWVGKL